MNTFPHNKLPDPSVDFSGRNESSTVRTAMDSGRIRQRRRYTQDFRTCSVSWDLDDTQFSLFQAFVFYKASSGADWFIINLPQGTGLRTYVARLREGSYGFTHQGILHWRVTAALELQDPLLMTEAAYDAAVGA